MNLNISCPINAVSFGHCSYNILKEFYNRGISPNLFPIAPPDLTCFDKAMEDFKFYLQACINRAASNYKRHYPEFRLWHIANSETSHSDKQSLLTFLETDTCTPVEVNILNNQANTFVTSSYTKEIMEENGVNNVRFVPLGFDAENYKRIEKHPYDNKCIVFGLLGKWEPKRKYTDKILKIWAAKYGNNAKYKLHLHCYNSFLDGDPAKCQQINANLIGQALEGKNYWNINIINNHLKTLTEYNNLINSCDILMGGGNENWNLPLFAACALGKYVITMNSNGVKDWATPENALLVEPLAKEPCYDNMFFREGGPFSQGNFFSLNEDGFRAAMDDAVVKYESNPLNKAGLELQKTHTYNNTVEILLKYLK